MPNDRVIPRVDINLDIETCTQTRKAPAASARDKLRLASFAMAFCVTPCFSYSAFAPCQLATSRTIGSFWSHFFTTIQSTWYVRLTLNK
jgi:hypothetical protein